MAEVDRWQVHEPDMQGLQEIMDTMKEHYRKLDETILRTFRIPAKMLEQDEVYNLAAVRAEQAMWMSESFAEQKVSNGRG